MKLYSYWRSSSAYRVRIALAWKGVAYDYVAVNIAPGRDEQLAPGFERVNGARRVPVLELDGEPAERLSESVAIVELLEQLFPEPALFPPAALQRAWVREAVELVNSAMQPLQNLSVLHAVKRLAPDASTKEWARSWLSRGFEQLERLAARRGGAFSVGDTPTAADVFLVPQLYAARRFELPLAAYPRLGAIEARCLELEAFRRAHPDVQPDAPTPPAASAAPQKPASEGRTT